MSRRKVVKLNLSFVNPKIKESCRNNVIFCEKMGRPNQKTWVTDWNRVDKNGNWAPKNLPSPEEAARMCILLDTTPEEILLHEGKTPEETAKCLEDIETVRKLVEAEMAKEKAHDPKTVGVSDLQKAAIQFVLSLPPEKLEVFLKMGRAAFEEKEYE